MKWKNVLAASVFAGLLAAAAAPASHAQATADSAATAARTQVNYESLMAAMGDIAGRVKEYNATKGKDAEDFQVVDVTTLLATDQAAYDEARARYVQFVDYLRGVAGKVTLMKNALATAEVEATDVVALDVLADGKIVLFYDTRELQQAQGVDTTQAVQDSTQKSTPGSN